MDGPISEELREIDDGLGLNSGGSRFAAEVCSGIDGVGTEPGFGAGLAARGAATDVGRNKELALLSAKTGLAHPIAVLK